MHRQKVMLLFLWRMGKTKSQVELSHHNWRKGISSRHGRKWSHKEVERYRICWNRVVTESDKRPKAMTVRLEMCYDSHLKFVYQSEECLNIYDEAAAALLAVPFVSVFSGWLQSREMWPSPKSDRYKVWGFQFQSHQPLHTYNRSCQRYSKGLRWVHCTPC